MKTIWVVEQGSYSDYRVVGVFTSKKNAKMIRDAINAGNKWSEASIAEWPLDPAVEELNAGMTHWHVLMLRNGDVEGADEHEPSGYDLAGECTIWKRPPHMMKPWGLQATVWATDKEHAIKIVNERRIALLAENQWPEKEGK